jgi:hypothetical protein
VKLRNLSEEGALIEGERLPLEGTTDLLPAQRIAPQGPRRVGYWEPTPELLLPGPLRPDEVLRNVPQPRQRQDADFRRPGLACRPLTDQERRMVEKWMVSSPMGSPGD